MIMFLIATINLGIGIYFGFFEEMFGKANYHLLFAIIVVQAEMVSRK